jgi:hypothetical protein
MSQPTFSEGPPVPLMVEGLIDEATLRQLFADLTAHAKILGVREKNAPTAYAGEQSLTVASAVDRLIRREARAVQVRYAHDGFEWTDTILVVPQGFRVIRCRHDAATRPSSQSGETAQSGEMRAS